MVSWKEEYEYFNNNLNYKFSKEKLDFFKTNPTDKQILILDKREDKIITTFCIIYFYGIITGCILLAFLIRTFGVSI